MISYELYKSHLLAILLSQCVFYYNKFQTAIVYEMILEMQIIVAHNNVITLNILERTTKFIIKNSLIVLEITLTANLLQYNDERTNLERNSEVHLK